MYLKISNNLTQIVKSFVGTVQVLRFELLKFSRGRSGSVVDCLTRDRGAAGSSLTGVAALWSLSKTHLSKLSTGSTQEDHPCLTERLLMGCKQSN